MSLFNELKRRNVFRGADVILNNIEAPGWIFQVILPLLGIGFLIAMLGVLDAFPIRTTSNG